MVNTEEREKQIKLFTVIKICEKKLSTSKLWKVQKILMGLETIGGNSAFTRETKTFECKAPRY